MKPHPSLKTWMIAGLVGVFVSACATTQDEIIEGDGPPSDEEIQMQGGIDDGSGADASALDGTGDGGFTTIVGDDGSRMGAVERLEQDDGDLSIRVVYFEFDSAKISDESLRILGTHGNFIATNPEVSVRLEGHADERGSREYNIALGDRRAQSVRRVLLFQGAAVDQVDTVSYGEERPAALGRNEEAWAKNRRVELIYTVN